MTELVSLKYCRFTYDKISPISKAQRSAHFERKSQQCRYDHPQSNFFYTFATTLFVTNRHESFFLSVVWCLDYQYTAYGDSQGQLNVYMLVNGERDEPLVSRSGSTSSILRWYREQIILHASHYSDSDMIEVS